MNKTKFKLTPNNSIITAVLIDGSFFLKRYRQVFKNGKNHSPDIIVENLYRMVHKHVVNEYLYRILFYDCMPYLKKIHHPITKQVIDFSKTTQAKNRLQFFDELKKKRKVALRLGRLRESKNWIIHPQQIKDLLSEKISISDLQKENVKLDLKQKGVDIKIGLDIASLAYKKLVHKIVLISGDSDFVPAAKLARREGIDFILDPMRNPIDPSLHEHIDGLKTTCPNPFHEDTKQYEYIIN